MQVVRWIFIFFQISNFLQFQLHFSMSLSTWDRNFLGFVKSAMTTWQQFDMSFIGLYYMLLLQQHMFIKKSLRGTLDAHGGGTLDHQFNQLLWV